MKFTECFSIARDAEDDWFDPDLAVDTPLFVDPFLLRDEAAQGDSIWSNAHADLIEHFSRCYALLADGAKGGLSEGVVRGLLSFPEPSEMCLGYTAKGTSGSGGGRRNATLIMGSIVTAIAAGLNRPRNIEEIGILNEGIGADRISDAACNVLKPISIEYTKKIATRHALSQSEVRVRHSRCDRDSGRWIDETHELPVNPFTGRAVLLLPQRFLNSLPTMNAYDWFGSSLNEDLRREMNVQVGQRVPKREIVRVARRHPDRIRSWAEELQAAGSVKGYDFDADPLGVVGWQDAGSEFANEHPLHLQVGNQSELEAFVGRLIEQYRVFIEKQRGWKLLWNDDGTEKPEEAAQLAFLGMTRHYCRRHGVELDREVDLGRGPVDFKISSGVNVRLLVEAKKLHNGDFWNGLESQLISYLESDETKSGWLLALRYRDGGVSKLRAQKLPGRVEAVSRRHGMNISFGIVDARPKRPASARGSGPPSTD